MAGSDQELEQVRQLLDQLQAHAPQLLRDKADRYRQIARTAHLEVPDTLLAKAWRWTQYASDWLRFEQPGIGTGLAAGIPDYPWFFGCDQTYSVRGLVAAGMPELARDILLTLLDLSEKTNGNGRIIHEASTNGAVFNPGNLNETPHFISACWDYFTWTADSAFLAKAWPYCRQGLSWLEQQDRDGNGYPDGHGMMEIRGMDAEMIDVMAYTAEAYLAAAKMATWFEQPDLAQQYRARGEQLRQKINTEWWVAAAKSFADFRAEAPRATQLLRDALVRADTLNKPWSVAELRQVNISPEPGIRPYAFYQNWVVNTPLETGLADSSLALEALETARRYTNPFGSYVTGIDRKAEQENPDGFAALKSKESFNYTGAVMTLPTGVQAISEARYGRVDTAYDYLQRLLRSFSYAAPGSMYEVSPDYGMLVQAWNVYALARPVVVHFLGIQPQAHHKTVRLQPQLPTTWPTAAIYDLPVGEARLTLQIKDREWTAELSEPGWTIEWIIPNDRLLAGYEGTVEHINGQRLLRSRQTTSFISFKP